MLAIAMFAVVSYKISEDLMASIDDKEQVIKLSLIIFSFVLIIIFCLAFMTTAYTLENGKLVIIRPAKNKEYDLADIDSFELTDRSKLKGTIRSFGVGGLFGYFGKFYNMRIGKMTYYATKKDLGILIRFKNGKIIYITPDDLDAFVKDLEISGRSGT